MSPSAPVTASRHNLTVKTSRTRMPSLFNTIRASIYAAVLLFTVICLAMAGHFQTVLAASDLTRFVPFAIFVCSASLIIVLVLLSFSLLLRERNPISTRIELACLGLAGMFWLVLGVYLTTSESQSADVECFASPTDTEPLDDSLTSFHTDQYQAMYRVLMTFALINATLVLASCFCLLFLAIRKHRKGDEHMWYGPVTSCAWFNSYGNAKQGSRAKTSSSSILPIATTVKPSHSSRRHHDSQTSPYAETGGRLTEKPAKSHSKSYPRSNPKPYQNTGGSPTRPTRHGSGRSSSYGSSTNEFDNGGMNNPYRSARGSR